MTSILEQYREQRQKLATSYIKPTRITFSPQGYLKMMAERDSLTLMLDLSPENPTPTTYDGLPFSVVNSQQDEIKLHNAMTDPYPRQIAVKLSVDMSDASKTIADIIGNSLSAPQLCDLIRGFLDADDATHWDEFEKDLDALLRKHSKFE